MEANYFFMLAEAPWAGPTAFSLDGDEFPMDRGRKLKSPPPLLQFELRVDRKANRYSDFPPLDLHATTARQVLFSDRLVNCLKSVSVSNVDYYDADVLYVPSGEKLQYHLGNVIGVLSIIDRSRSTFNATDAGLIYELLSIEIDESKCEGQDFFRFKELSNLIVISRRIKVALEDAGITGTKILSAPEWRPGLI